MSWNPHEDVNFDGLKTSVIIVSDSLFSGENQINNDVSGPTAIELLSEAGLDSINLDYYPDDTSALQSKIEADLHEKIDLIIFIGGTGISPRDVTIEAIKSKFSKSIPGFGEEFRRLSIQEIQGKGYLSRAAAGTIGQSIIVALPGSPKAVTLGINITLQFLGHAIQLLRG